MIKSDFECSNCKANMYWSYGIPRVNLGDGYSKKSSFFECQVCGRKEEVICTYQETMYGEMWKGSETLVHWPGMSLNKAMKILKNFANDNLTKD